jgi:hypothetical protein
MIDPDELLLKTIADALDECGLSPLSDQEDAKAFVNALRERGYEVRKMAFTEEE